MEKYTMFMDWKNQYSENEYTKAIYRFNAIPIKLLLLLLLSRFSRVRLCATPWTVAHQAPPPMGFSRQDYWSGVPLPSPPIKLPTVFFRVRTNNFTICMEIQKTLNSQSNLEKEE